MKTIKSVLFLLITVLLLSSLKAQEIFEISKTGNLNRAKELLAVNPQLVYARDSLNRTPLHWAARGVHDELMEFLLESGADVNAVDTNHITALISVTTRNHPEALKLLIDHGANVNIKTNSDYTALHYAASDGYVEIVKLLIKNGAQLEICNDYKRTPLLLAAREMGGLETIRILVEAGANVNVSDYSEDTPLSLAAWRGYEEIVDYLLDKGAEIGTSEKKLKQLMYFAINKRLWKLYKTIKQTGIDLFRLNLKGITLLHIAAKGGSVQIVNDLTEQGFDINAKDIYGWTPVHYAAENGRLDVIKILVEKGAEINIKSRISETPYNLAVKANKKDVVDYLISKGVDKSINEFTDIKGKYLGQTCPDETPQIFAPGIVNELVGGHSNITFSPNGEMAVWTKWIESERGYTIGSLIIYSQMIKGKWSVPNILMEDGDTPFFSVDGKKLYYLKSVRNPNGGYLVREIQFLEIKDKEFSKPEALTFDIEKTGLYWQFSLDKDEHIYFSGAEGLSRSLLKNGKYQPLEKLNEIFHPDYKGGSPYISPNADYLIFSSRELPGSYGQIDLYIGFKKPDGTWTKPINMGDKINTSGGEHLPIVTTDGKYLFFVSSKDGSWAKYWVDAKIIEDLKPVN